MQKFILPLLQKVLGSALVLMAMSLSAQEESEVARPTATLDAMYSELMQLEATTKDLQKRVESRDGFEREILEKRLALAHMALMKKGLGYVRRVIADVEFVIAVESVEAVVGADTETAQSPEVKQDKIVKAVVADFDPHIGQAVAMLDVQPERVKQAFDWILDKVEFPESGLSAAAEAAAYSRVFDENRQINELYSTYMISLEYAQKMGLDTEDDIEDLKETLGDRAASIAAFLHLANDDVKAIKAGTAVLPDDIELKARLAVTEDRVLKIAAALDATVKMMNKLGMPTAIYSEMVIGATGQLTAEAIVGSGVMARLLAGWGDKLTDMVINEAPDLLIKVLLFLLILWIAKKLSRLAEKIAALAVARSGDSLSTLLRRMVISSVRNLVFIFGVLIALSQVGISLGPVLAGLGVAGFVIGFAMQDVLSNFASGVMVLIYRPFDVGDVVEAGGILGKVSHMSLVNTTILTFDNQNIVIPNNRVWSDIIKNLTYQKTRRVDLIFGVSYSDDIDKVEAILCDIIEKDERILDSPEPIVKLNELGDSSVNFVTRSWVVTTDYWDVYWDTLRAVKKRFDAEGISIPFPQRDLHLDTSKPLNVRIDPAD